MTSELPGLLSWEELLARTASEPSGAEMREWLSASWSSPGVTFTTGPPTGWPGPGAYLLFVSAAVSSKVTPVSLSVTGLGLSWTMLEYSAAATARLWCFRAAGTPALTTLTLNFSVVVNEAVMRLVELVEPE